jgi:anti-sigma regulatory factor (Ser/Thr protein kinase)
VAQLSARLDMSADRLDARRHARRAAAGVLAGWRFRDPALLADAQLLVSELVMNAVRHGGGLIELQIDADADTVTISAADGSSVVPRQRPADAHGGQGLTVIDGFAKAWGVQSHDVGKRLWVRLQPCTPEPTEGANGC